MNNIPDNYLDKNRDAWNQRTSVHISSAFYDMPAFMAGKSSLKQPELELLGDIAGKSVLHLQCHFGQDTLSLARMGAKATGIDLSDVAIAEARKLNTDLGLDAAFLCCDLYSLPDLLDEQFDIVFTSYGAIGWLPDLDRWAAVVSRFLKKGGRFIMVEFHPVIWMFDNDFTHIRYSYFNTAAIEEHLENTYADRTAALKGEEVSWNHSLDEVLGSLLRTGLQVTGFREYDHSVYNCFPGMEAVAEDVFRIKSLGAQIPYMYSVTAKK